MMKHERKLYLFLSAFISRPTALLDSNQVSLFFSVTNKKINGRYLFLSKGDPPKSSAGFKNAWSSFKNAWSYISTPKYAFMSWCLVKHRENFTLDPLLTYILTYLLHGAGYYLKS
jgi:hypothetical protein